MTASSQIRMRISLGRRGKRVNVSGIVEELLGIEEDSIGGEKM